MACSKTQRKTGLAAKEAGERSALLFTCFHAPLIQAADPIPLRLWRGRGQTKGRSGGSGAQYPGKMLESGQVLPFQTQRCARCFHKCHTRVSSAALGGDTGITRSGDTPQSAPQRGIENTKWRGLENYQRHKTGWLRVWHISWSLRHTTQEVREQPSAHQRGNEAGGPKHRCFPAHLCWWLNGHIDWEHTRFHENARHGKW